MGGALTSDNDLQPGGSYFGDWRLESGYYFPILKYGYAMVEALWARRKPSYAAAGAGDVFSLFHLQPGYVIHVTTGEFRHAGRRYCISSGREWIRPAEIGLTQ
ncbi:uncharacterized protein [Physcomitrium patens]